VTPSLCVGAVAVEDGGLLLVLRGTEPGAGRWSVPGGRVEPGETVAAAVVREVAEETGLEALCDDLLGIAEIIDDLHHFVILDFRVSILQPGTPEPGDDAADAAWVPLDAVRDLPLVDGLEAFLEDHGILEPLRPFRI
jgi:ADP-ribose pyrophosphatase YjhB (NUDIX family)